MRSLFFSFMDAWNTRAALGDNKRSREELAFLPAALEIMEAPPHPLAHWLGCSLMLLCVIALSWACVSHVNIVTTAEGKIIPSSRIKLIQPSEKGVVKTIFVKEGDHVMQGQPLLELDRTLTASDQKRFADELNDAQAEMDRLQKFIILLNCRGTACRVPTSTVGVIHESPIQQQLLEQQWQQYLAQRSATESALESHKAEKQSSLEQIKKLQQTLPLVTKRAEGLKTLMEKQMASESEYSQMEEQRITQQQDLATQLANQKQLDAEIKQAEEQLKALIAQTQSETLEKMIETRSKIGEAKEGLTKAIDINARQILYAPVSGQVQGLAINTIGGVVTEAQQLMTIVPEGENLEVEAYLQNQDIGFVHKSDTAEIKIHTFPFTQYGVIHAGITRISHDAFSIGKNQGDKSKSVPTDPQNEVLVYTMGLVMEKSSIRVNGEDVALMPGMAVTAEVATGNRRVIEFFLAPLLKAKQESIRER